MRSLGKLDATKHRPIVPSRLLLIDDDYALLEGLADMIRIRFPLVQVDTSHNPALVINMVEEKAYDLILCDVSMPTINGLELLPRLRQAAPTASILMMSAVGDCTIGNRVLAAGATGFVAKPFDREALTVTLRQALQRHHLPQSFAGLPTAV